MEPIDLNTLKAQAAVELKRLEAQATAKEVAAKAIGKIVEAARGVVGNTGDIRDLAEALREAGVK